MPAPDVNTNEQTMAWIMDTYSMHTRHTVTAVVTGKPLDLGGSRGRTEATGRGCMIVTLQALKRLGMEPASTRVVIQGFGNVGGMAARLMAAQGFKIIAIVEYDGAVYNPNGLDIEALMAHRKETGSIADFPPKARTSTARRPCSWSATCCCPPPPRTSSLRRTRTAALQDSVRRRQRPHHSAGRRDPGGQRRSS